MYHVIEPAGNTFRLERYNDPESPTDIVVGWFPTFAEADWARLHPNEADRLIEIRDAHEEAVDRWKDALNVSRGVIYFDRAAQDFDEEYTNRYRQVEWDMWDQAKEASEAALKVKWDQRVSNQLDRVREDTYVGESRGMWRRTQRMVNQLIRVHREAAKVKFSD